MYQGAPISMARKAQVTAAKSHLTNFLALAKDYPFEEKYDDSGEHIIKEAVGVCALITPWNWCVSQPPEFPRASRIEIAKFTRADILRLYMLIR